VHLTGNHPQDPLRIRKHQFEATCGREDIVSIREAIKVALKVVEHPNISVRVEGRMLPDASVLTDAEIEDYILQTVYGHHVCCTAAMGADDDPNAVLDGDFKVRGVKNLRVM
ncbi:glucose-methanol-choline oxidoreductase, partial [Mycena sp. CBHHK59/15]